MDKTKLLRLVNSYVMRTVDDYIAVHGAVVPTSRLRKKPKARSHGYLKAAKPHATVTQTPRARKLPKAGAMKTR